MTPELVNQYKEQGFFLIENGLPSYLLKAWRDLADEARTNGLAAYAKDTSYPGTSVIEHNGQPLMTRYNDLEAIDHNLLLPTLSCPTILQIAKSVVGRGCVPVAVDLQYKYQYPYNWHQDASVITNTPYITVGMYLDDADANDGCVQYLPGSQFSVIDIQKLEQDHGWEIPGHVIQPVKAGDILVHDSMVLHGSKPKRHAGTRRTIYLEFWTWQDLVASGQFSQEWIELRKRWMALIIAHDQNHIWPEDWKADYPNIQDTEDLLKRIMEKQEPYMKPNWATFPVDRDDYPTPLDMKQS